MWGTSRAVKLKNLKNKRYIYTSSSNHRIIFNQGQKDDFQVSIIEGENVYAMGDVDYFTIIKKYYTTDYNRKKISKVIRCFAKVIEIDTGQQYSTFKDTKPKHSFGEFNLTEGTFGFQEEVIKVHLNHFKSYYDKCNILENNSELEEALVIIYLAMIAEWYYVVKRSDGSITKSRWQHRVKLLGLLQVLKGVFSPAQAADWSKNNGKNFAKAMIKVGLNPHPFNLK